MTADDLAARCLRSPTWPRRHRSRLPDEALVLIGQVFGAIAEGLAADGVVDLGRHGRFYRSPDGEVGWAAAPR